MTNGEKARAIAQEHEKYTEDCRINLHLEGKSEVDVARETAYAAALEMAEWKDEQFRMIMEKIIDLFDEYPSNVAFSKDNVVEMFKTIKKTMEE